MFESSSSYLLVCYLSLDLFMRALYALSPSIVCCSLKKKEYYEIS